MRRELILRKKRGKEKGTRSKSLKIEKSDPIKKQFEL
jgi:hypothetical protein